MNAKKIFIVEDEALLAADISNTLETIGYTVVGTAGTGEKAVIEIQNVVPDLILMDINLKGKMDGIETAQKINEEMDFPVIFLTAFADNEYLERAKISEPFGYLVKPAGARELKSSIEMALYKAEIDREKVELIEKLRKALDEIKTLEGLLPICSNCKKIREEGADSKDMKSWTILEEYISDKTDANFSHGICPDCVKELYPDLGRK